MPRLNPQVQYQNPVELDSSSLKTNCFCLPPLKPFRSASNPSSAHSSKKNNPKSTKTLESDPTAPRMISGTDTSQFETQAFIRYRPPRVSMLPVENVPLPPSMHRTYNPVSSKSPKLPISEFDALFAELATDIIFQPFLKNLEKQHKKETRLDSVVEETKESRNQNSYIQTPDKPYTAIPKKLFDPEITKTNNFNNNSEVKNNGSNNTETRITQFSRVHNSEASFPNSKLNISTKGLDGNSLLDHNYSYKNHPQVCLQLPLRANFATVNKQPQHSMKSNPKISNKPRNSPNHTKHFTENSSVMRKVSLKASRSIRNGINLNATLQAIRNDGNGIQSIPSVRVPVKGKSIHFNPHHKPPFSIPNEDFMIPLNPKFSKPLPISRTSKKGSANTLPYSEKEKNKNSNCKRGMFCQI